jgi:vacuolar-type H+-ATPase subunit H
LELSAEVLNQARKDAREIMKHSEYEAKLIISDAKRKRNYSVPVHSCIKIVRGRKI